MARKQDKNKKDSSRGSATQISILSADAFRIVLLHQLMYPEITHGRTVSNPSSIYPLVNEGDLKIGVLGALGMENAEDIIAAIQDPDFTALFNTTLTDCVSKVLTDRQINRNQTVHEIKAAGVEMLKKYGGAEKSLPSYIIECANLSYDPPTPISQKVIPLDEFAAKEPPKKFVEKLAATQTRSNVLEHIHTAGTNEQFNELIDDSKNHIDRAAREDLNSIFEAIKAAKKQQKAEGDKRRR